MKKKKIIIWFVLLMLICSISFLKVSAEESNMVEPILGEPTFLEEPEASVVTSNDRSITGASSATNEQKSRSKEEIKQKYLDAQTTVTSATAFDVTPVIEGPNYKEGTLSSLAKSDMLKQLNFFRYLAGVGDVSIFEQYMTNNGKGAVLLSASDFSHYPDKPADMSDEFYNAAIQGTALPTGTGYSVGGNISAGDFFTNSVKGFVDDTSNVVANNVGHRLSLLNPKAVGTSFGYSKGDSSSKTSGHYGQYTTITMYSSSTSSTGKYYTWPPAGYCPVEVTDNGELWSIMLDSNYSVNTSSMTINVSCDGKTYTIDSNIYNDSYYNAIYFALPSELESAIVQGGQYADGKVVSVTINGGITDKTTSQAANINYSVEFFVAKPIPITGFMVFERELGSKDAYYSFSSASGYVGGGKELYIRYEPSNTTEKGIEVSFSNPNVASYDSVENAIIYTDAGITDCTIKSVANPSISSNFKFTVYNEIEEIHLEKYCYTINRGESAQANVIYTPSDNLKEEDKAVTYEIEDTSIATVNSKGLITAKKAGETTITIKNEAGLTNTSNIKVEVPVETISFDKNVYEGMLGEQIPCNITVTPEDATYKDHYMYSYNEEELICYRNVNTIKGLKAGEYDVKVSVTGKEDVAKVRIYEPMTSFEVINKNAEIYINQTYPPILINVKPDGDFTNTDCILETSNANIAKIENGQVVGIAPGTATITVRSKYNPSVYRTFEITVKKEKPYANVEYTTHVENIGWQDYVKNGEMAGTSGRSYRLEGIKIKVDSNITGNIEYATHVQNIGWQDFVKNDALSGTSGRGLRLEAIKIRLTDELKDNYDIYYRVHAQNVGWLDWAKNGEESGTAGYGYRLEGIEIKLVEKGAAAPGNTDKPFVIKPPTVEYTTHVQNVGWQAYVKNGQMAGTSGKGLRLEGIKIKLSNQNVSGNIEYTTHVENIGWQDFVKNDALSGTSGRGLRLEAIKIRLTDELAEKYDIYYRVHAQNAGWLGWAKNGEESGTAGYGFRLEGIEIQVVEKGAKAPGSTENSFMEK